MQIGNIAEGKSGWDNPQTGRIYSAEGCSPTLNTCNGGGHEPKILIDCDKSHNSPQIIERANCITAREDRGISNHKSEGTAVIEKIGNDNLVMEGEILLPYIRIRKLTPKECHRLMGFDDIDVDRCKAVGMSDAQGYKQAGNSIVTNVIALIAEHFYKAQYDESYKCLDEKMVNFQKPQME